MDPVILLSYLLQPIINFVLATIKNPTSIANLKRAEPLIRAAGNALIMLADAISAKGPMVKGALRKAALKAKALLK